MNHLLPFLFLLLAAVQTFAQQNTGVTNNTMPGVQLLFKNIKTKLTNAEQSAVFRQLGFGMSKDRKQFIADADGADAPFDAQVFPTDLNKDGVEEVFVVYGNSYTSGATGSSVVLFIKNTAGVYEDNLGFPGTVPDVLPTASKGYPDLLIGGPGFEHPVWRWNGKSYAFLKKVSDQALKNTKSIEEISKAYTKGQ